MQALHDSCSVLTLGLLQASSVASVGVEARLPGSAALACLLRDGGMHACMHACFSSSAHAANEACGTGWMQWIASARSRTFVGASKGNCAAAPAPVTAPLLHPRHLICYCLVLALLLLIAGTVACTRKERKTSTRGNLCLKVKAAVVGPAIQESPKINAQKYCSVGYSCNRPWEREKANREVQRGKPKGTLESESRIAW